VSTESTVLDPVIPSPPTNLSGAAGEATDGQVQLPEPEEITLKPSKGFPRRLIIEWAARRVEVTLTTAKGALLVWTTARHADVTLVARDQSTYRSLPKTSYNLWAGEPSFKLSEREFETLAAKLEPRGVKVTRL
jgi:hypothetical protein